MASPNPYSNEELKDLLKRVHKQISEIDPFAIAVLKAHLLVEEQVDSLLEVVAERPKHLGLEGNPSFFQKVKWIRAFGPLGDSVQWQLILALNTLRNKVAHKFDGPERENAIANLRDAYRRGREPDPNDKELGDYDLVLISSMVSVAFLVKIRCLIPKKKT